MSPTGLPFQRSIIAVDIEDSTARPNPAKARLRDLTYEFLQKALQQGGIAEHHRDPFIDRGDGILALIHAADQVPKALLLNPVVPTLSRLLTDHGNHHPAERFRLRAAVHAGDVHYDSNGCFGEALDITFRLLNAPTVKKRLRATTAPLILVVSNDIYRSVIRHGYHGPDSTSFKPIHVHIAGHRHVGWVQQPPH